MQSLRPQPKILTVWRILLALAAIPAAFLCSLLLEPGSRGWMLATALWLLLFLVGYLLYLPALYAGFSFRLSGRAVVAERGVFYRKQSALPLSGVQFATIVAGPVQRLFGLCSLLVAAPGARLLLPGLTRQDAAELARILTRREGD